MAKTPNNKLMARIIDMEIIIFDLIVFKSLFLWI